MSVIPPDAPSTAPDAAPAEGTGRPRIGIILSNLGTPDAPTPAAVRAYLREFLSDTRVIEVPRLVWFFILRLFVLPFRPRRVAHAYAGIWQEDSPMRLILAAQVAGVQQRLDAAFPGADVLVRPGMSYGRPALRASLDELQAAGCDQLLVLPLFPQYSATSSAVAYDQTGRWLRAQRRLPGLQIVRDYHDHPGYIAALADSIRRHWAVHGRAERLLFSYHGIPQPYADKGDPYPQQCHATTAAVVRALGLAEGEWGISFQSRFGLQEWVKPYTSELLAQWGGAGVASVQVLCPAFSADCLETLEEIAVENRDIFLKAGGQRYEYVPALNADPVHLDFLAGLLAARITALS